MSIWTAKYNGTEKTFAAWGMRQNRLSRRSQAVDEFEFSVVVEKFENTIMFAYQSKVEIFEQPDEDDAASKYRYFVGWVSQVPRQHAPNSEAHSYRLSNLWWWFSKLVFQKLWYRAVDPVNPDSSIVGGYTPRILLNVGINGTRLKTKAQLEEIVAYVNQSAVAQSMGAIVQAGAGYPDIQIPIDELKNVTCEECIRKQLRWLADAVTWVDYTTEPPTLHIKRRGDLAAVSLTVGVDINACQISERDDLRVPAVILKYEQSNQVNGAGWLYVTEDAYPLGASDRQFGALITVINLQGWNASLTIAEIETFNWWGNWDAWLKKNVPMMADPKFNQPGTAFENPIFNAHSIEYDDGTVYDMRLTVAQNAANGASPPSLLQEITSGSIKPGRWSKDNGFSIEVAAERYTVKGTAAYVATFPDGHTLPVQDKEFSFSINATNATTGRYTKFQLQQDGDPVPVGLAETVYTALNQLQYDGTFTLKRQEVPAVPSVGNVVNILGGRAEWATARALVQTVVDDIDGGVKTVSVGVAKYLTAGEMVDLLMVVRPRMVITAPDSVDSGVSPTTQVELPTKADKKEGFMSDTGQLRMVMSPYTRETHNPVLGVNPSSYPALYNSIDIDSATCRVRLQATAKTGELDPKTLTGTGVEITEGSDVDIRLSAALGKKVKLVKVRLPMRMQTVTNQLPKQLKVYWVELLVLADEAYASGVLITDANATVELLEI